MLWNISSETVYAPKHFRFNFVLFWSRIDLTMDDSAFFYERGHWHKGFEPLRGNWHKGLEMKFLCLL